MRKYDIVIVGCGMAGALAGLTALKKGCTVCIIEKKEQSHIGQKACGELMPIETLTWMHNEFGITTKYYPLKGLEICDLSEHQRMLRSKSRYKVYVEEPLATIDRWQFGQTLVENLLGEGADIYQETVVECITAPAGNGNAKITGVKTDTGIHKGEVTIDCSGVNSVIREQIVGSDPEPAATAYKEEVVLDTPKKLDYAMILLDKRTVPSGYMWCFPKSETVLNIGAGGLELGPGEFKEILTKDMKIHRTFSIKETRSSGTGVIPTRRPLSSMVYPGLLFCGDSAYHVNPLTGEGIAPALKAGYYAGKVAASAVHNGDISINGLWEYNIDFAKEYGVIHAPLSAIRDLLLSLTAYEVAFLIENVVTGVDVAQLETEGMTIPWKRRIGILVNNWRKLGFLYTLYSFLNKMNTIKELYQEYPQTADKFPEWNKKLNKALNK
ncbi:MAG: NAD(P)/FAD-dependent oxidoreductase [Candidatus Methanofastidiosia archaeon]